MSGHNKWSTIKRKKGALDAKRSKIFSKIIKEITVAVKESGASADGNPRLRLAINNAKGVNMPKDNIARAIHKADSDSFSFQESVFEGYSPGGVAIIIECLSDNHQRTLSNVRSIFTRRGGSLGTKGSLSFIFDRKGMFNVLRSHVKMPHDDFELEMIDAGAEDFLEEADRYIITTAMEDFGSISKKLDDLKIDVENAQLSRIPNTFKEVDVDTARSVLKTIDALEDDDDVQNVYHNMQMTDEIEQALQEED